MYLRTAPFTWSFNSVRLSLVSLAEFISRLPAPQESQGGGQFGQLSLFFSDFKQLSSFHRVQALWVAAQNPEKAPKIAAYAVEFFHIARKGLKETKFEKETELSPLAVDSYYRVVYAHVLLVCPAHRLLVVR